MYKIFSFKDFYDFPKDCIPALLWNIVDSKNQTNTNCKPNPATWQQTNWCKINKINNIVKSNNLSFNQAFPFWFNFKFTSWAAIPSTFEIPLHIHFECSFTLLYSRFLRGGENEEQTINFPYGGFLLPGELCESRIIICKLQIE